MVAQSKRKGNGGGELGRERKREIKRKKIQGETEGEI
jgi:hypothetical protein